MREDPWSQPACDPVVRRDTALEPQRLLDRGDSPNLSGSTEDENGTELCLQARGCGGIHRPRIQAHSGRWSRPRAAEPLRWGLPWSGMINNDTVVVHSTRNNTCSNTPELSLWLRAKHVTGTSLESSNYPFIGEAAQV